MTDAMVYRYDRRAVITDALRALAGMAITIGPLAVFNVGSVMVYILAGLGALFLAFGLRTLLRHLTYVEVTAGGIRIAGLLGRSIRWRDLDGMSLRFYTTRRDKLDGWMLLKIMGNEGVIAVDSTLEGFDGIVRHARNAARDKGIALNTATLTNLVALGIDAPGASEP